MNNTAKLIIPLLYDKFDLNDFSAESGFIEGYVTNKNKPSLTNHTFLVYDANLDTVEKVDRDAKMRNCPYLYSRRIIWVSKTPYMIYTFVNMSKSIRRLRDGFMPYDREDYLRIMRFWNFSDEYVNSFLLNPLKGVDIGLDVPEEDYIPGWGDELNK